MYIQQGKCSSVSRPIQ